MGAIKMGTVPPLTYSIPGRFEWSFIFLGRSVLEVTREDSIIVSKRPELLQHAYRTAVLFLSKIFCYHIVIFHPV